MVSIKIKLRHSSVSGVPGTVVYVLHEGMRSVRIATEYKLFPEEWDEKSQSVVFREKYRFSYVTDIDLRIKNDVSALQNIIKSFPNYSAKDILQAFHIHRQDKSFLAFMDKQIRSLIKNGCLGTARNYMCTRNSFASFLHNQDIEFYLMTEDFILEYDSWLRKKGITRNSVSFYMRILRSVYNKAAAKMFFNPENIFRKVYTGIDRTRKRAVNEEIIVRLSNLDLSEHKALDYARDIFIFSFYTRGMAFVDIAYLRKSNIRNGFIQYIRRKTGQIINIRIESCMKKIMDHYKTKSEYIFPIITSSDEKIAYRQYQNSLSYYNKQLKKISDLLGLSSPLTSYTARHTWATAARNKNIPLSVISAGMGHTSEKTTQIYLASLDNSIIDEANKFIISSLYYEGDNSRKKKKREV